jgi:hypothetical protein
MAAQHAGLSAERWASFPRSQQILMIANEMNRASKLFAPADRDRLRSGHERVLALANLTIELTGSRSLRRELLRFRDLVAQQYVALEPAPAAHAAIFRALLQLDPEAWKQLPHVTGAARF